MTHHAPFPCDPQLWHRFLAACQSRDETPGAVLRDLVRLEVQRVERRAARRDDVIDEQLFGRLRASVAEALVASRNWGQMQAALRARGLQYIQAGGGLNLIDPETGEVLCKGSQVGPGYQDLVRRFGTGFPGHPRPGLAAVAFTRSAGAMATQSP
jgi:ATP-dependent DNA helicase RecQ